MSLEHEGYEYDEVDRLKRWFPVDGQGAAVANGWEVAYSHDDLGNLTSRSFTGGSATGGGTAQSLSYEYAQGTRNAGPHAVSSVTESSVTTAPFSYDLNGNMISGTTGEIALSRPDT